MNNSNSIIKLSDPLDSIIGNKNYTNKKNK